MSDGLAWEVFRKNTKSSPPFGATFFTIKVINFDQKWFGYNLGDFFANLFGHTAVNFEPLSCFLRVPEFLTFADLSSF
jgi:hypothetical protein